MEKQFTLETRLSLDDEAKKYLNEYITFYNMISRNLWQIVRKSNFKEVYKRSDFNTYDILKRTANSIYSELLSKKNSLLELKKTEIYNCNIRYSKLSIEKDNLKGIIIFTILTLLIKEDAPVYAACIGLYVIVGKKKSK